MSLETVEAALRALMIELAAAYRTVETLSQLQAWGEGALEQLNALHIPPSLRSNNVSYWGMEARRSAYFRTVQTWEPERGDGAGVFYALAQMKLELRRAAARRGA